MKIGIFGLPSSGKTTVFNALTGLHADTTPGGRSGVNLGVTRVPDARVDYLARIYEPKKTTYAELRFADMPRPTSDRHGGIVAPQVAAELRAMDVLVAVLRAFDSPLVSDPPDAARDLDTLETELILLDLGVVEKRLERIWKEKGTEREAAALERCKAHLEEGLPLRTLDLAEAERALLRGYQFLSDKTLLVLVNTPEDDPAARFDEVDALSEAHGCHAMSLCATMEAEIAELSAEEQREFLADLGFEESGRDRFVRHAYAALDLISFLTGGRDECRAWTIRRGTRAVDAAARIHTDIARGFIRAEVISFEDFERFGGDERKARAAGRYRLEGKDYIVQDGDIIHFRFNV